jgi:outer membrane lipase/esterase
MRTFQRTLLASAVALALSSPAAAQFSNAIFFGDSLVDAGSFKPVLPPGTGLFTTNPGPLWVTPFGQTFGFSVSPANQGGTDYAYGGARVTELPGVPPTPPTGAAVPIATQIANFLAKGPADSTAIYAINGGANDIFTQLTALQAGTITQAQAQANVSLAAAQLAAQIVKLNVAGAQYIVVWNVPDIGTTPFGLSVGPAGAAQLTAISQLFNTTLFGRLNATSVPTIRFNAFSLLNEITANPSLYGFTNATTPACGMTPSLLCTSANFVTPTAAQTYVFADDVHPTTGAHALIAQAITSMITGPEQMAALGDAPLRVEDADFRTLDGRMWSGLNSPRASKKLEAWAAYDYGSIDMNAGPSNGTAHQNTVAVGGDMKINESLLAGIMFAYTQNKGDFGGAGGGYTLRQPVFTGYAGYGDGPWYVGATFGAGSLDYSDINRDIQLGPAVRTESGTTRGYEYTGRLLGGYWFKYQDILHGPYARMTYTKAIVRQFAENGADSTALTYGQQSNEQLLWSVGWQVAGSFGSIRPWARATWEYDSLDKDRVVTASSNTLGGSYGIPAPKPDNSYALFNVGAAADFGGVTGFVSGSGTASKGDGNYWAVTVGLRMPL